MQIKLPRPGWITHYKCMFFDFDGVVLESGQIKTEAFLELYKGMGISDQVKEHHLSNQGVSRFEKFRWISENLLNEEHTPEKGKALGERFSALVKQKVLEAPFVNGFEQLIRACRSNDVFCVIASGTPQEELEDIVMRRQLEGCFDKVYGSPMEKDDIIRKVLKEEGYDKEECIFFGDASTDYEAADIEGLDFYARLTEELSEYWTSVDYKYGTLDFSECI